MSAFARHQCMIYQGSPSRQLPAVAATMQRKLEDNYRCLYLDSPAMLAGMRSRLAAIGVDVIGHEKKSSLILTSQRDHLVDGRFDADQMLATLAAALQQALDDGYQGLCAIGDMSWEAGFHSNFPTLLDYELRLEDFFRTHPQLHGICQYHKDTLPRQTLDAAVLTHQSFFINETLSRLNLRFVRAERRDDLTTRTWQFDDLIDRLCESNDLD